MTDQRSADPDSLYFDVYCQLPPGYSVPASVQSKVLGVDLTREGGTALTIASRTIECEWEERQAQFEEAFFESMALLRQVLPTLESLGSKPVTQVIVAMVPEDGHAGIYISSEMLGAWAEVRAELLISAWPGQIWFDARYPQESRNPVPEPDLGCGDRRAQR